MYCPYCKYRNSRVIDKRDNEETQRTRRRRECEKCRKRFTTYERAEDTLLYVVKRGGEIEQFSKDKLKNGIVKAVKKRKIPSEKIDSIVESIERYLLKSNKQKINSKIIGQMVLTRLAKTDTLGALLFAAVYREFDSLEDVKDEIKRLSEKKNF